MPGKFEACADEDVGRTLHEMSLDGCCETVGDVADFGHFCLLTGTGIAGAEHAIVEEDGQGFVTYTTFDTEEDAREAFAEVEREAEEFYNACEGA